MSGSIESSQFTQEVALSPRRGRRFGVYRDILGYRGREAELAGKTILDVGAGDSGFAEEAVRYGAHVVQLDPKYNPRPKDLTEEERKLYQYAPPFFKEGAIAAVGQQLPFKDESFDEVSALYSVYWMRIGVTTALQEMLRVTKENGTISLWPAKITAQQIEKLPSFMHVRKVNPDYGCPTVLNIIKDPEISSSQWDHILKEKVVPHIIASDAQHKNAVVYASKTIKPNPTGFLRNT